ncbi:MAG: hypothetical protein WC710_14640 [Gallionella sp.]|jgi:hypothetical protein
MQQQMWFDDEFEALNLMVSNSKRSPKELAGFLFPHLKQDSAYARLKACLSPDKDERLTFGQIIAAMKFCECYEPLLFACDETCHARPARISPRDEEVKLVEAISGATETLNKAMRQLENLRTRSTI